MKAKACLCVMSIMLMPLFARACDVQPAASAFFFDNDTNRDGAVDTAEWRLAQIPVAGLYMPRFNIGSMAAFMEEREQLRAKIGQTTFLAARKP